MALANKLGGLLKKATSSNPSIYQAIRCMSSSKLFVGGLSYGTDDHSLRDAFSNYGQVIEARVIMDRESGRSRGFGFITYTSSEEASAAITAMDGKDLHGRNIRVNHATERTGGFRAGGGGGFGGGGYGGGGGGYGGGGYGGGYGGGSSGGGGYGGNYGNRVGGGYGGGGGSGGNFAAGGGDGFGSNFGGDSGFGAAGGSTGGDEFSAGGSFSSNKNDGIMDDMFKDDEPDNYADKRA
ncbi:glycine-rich RNA-binding protein 4, mitochondrial [Panicum miliaceum]|uniref:Glycine-rich RNA-binding protein 4, mitochondrial n=1 Tax=Panicum miliaceum TaxID=4540 RepID=A0A3L6RCG6_PANMI|nr:glycine-rich RNA-binding protein 4, mitochondrial [Panicum miliaceum]